MTKHASPGPRYGHDGPIGEYEEIVAFYEPAVASDLIPAAVACIGAISHWEAIWIIEDEDSERYSGQWAMFPLYSAGFPFVWVPECDLKRVGDG